jgi:hypothetical protein
MNVNQALRQRIEPTFTGRSQGFALVIALGLMGFVLVLLLTIVTLVRVETTSAGIQKDKSIAQQNAYLGLMVAMGELQRAVGPDTRVMTTADGLGMDSSGVGKWLGVWDSSAVSSGVTWLVSGDAPNPSSPPSDANTIDLVGLGSLGSGESIDDIVVAERIEISDNTGGYAWWVSDESAKMSVQTEWSAEDQWEAFGSISSTLKPESIEESMAYRVPVRRGLEQVFEGYDSDVVDLDQIAKLSSLSQLDLLGMTYEDAFHATTLMSMGLLTNPVEGGFKFNLTDDADNDPYDFVNDAVEAFLEVERASAAGTYYNPYRGDTPFTVGIGDAKKLTNGEYYEPDPVLVVTPPSYNGSKSVLFPDMTKEGDSYPFYAPVVTEFALKMAITNVSENDTNVDADGYDYIRAEFVYELWNPYPFTLEMSRQLPSVGTGTGFFASRLFVSNFSSNLDVTLLRAPGLPGNESGSSYSEIDSYQLDLNNMYYVSPYNRYFNYYVGIGPYIERKNGELDQDSDGNANVPGILYPGEVYAARRPYSLSNSNTVMQRRANTTWQYTELDSDLSLEPSESGKAEWLYQTDMVHIKANGTFDVSFLMYLANPAPYTKWDGESMDDVQLQIKNVPFVVDVEDMPVTADTRQKYHYAKASDYLKDNFQFGVHFKVKDDLESLKLLSEKVDIRSPVLDWNEVKDLFEISFFGLGEDPDLFVFSYMDLFRHDSDDYVNGPENYRFSTYDDFMNNSRFVRLFDVPTFAPVSLDVFRSAFFVGLPPYSFGEPQTGSVGDTLNAAFDRYFMTGITSDWRPTVSNGMPDSPLPNPNLMMLNDAESSYTSGPAVRLAMRRQDAAEHSMIRGSFNINSTSVDAWAAMLSSPFSYKDEDGEAATRFGVFLHMPHQPDVDADMLDDALSDSELAGLSSTGFRNQVFTQTIRVLDLDEMTGEAAAIRELAEDLVQGIQTWATSNGRPFVGVEEFLNSGVLSDAIETSGINNIGPYELPPISPLYLSQSKLIGLFATSAVARGDTFIIRTCGDTVNPITGEIDSKAWLEAVVQRIPEYVDDSQEPQTDTGLNATNDSMGRRLRIVSLHWMSEDEI